MKNQNGFGCARIMNYHIKLPVSIGFLRTESDISSTEQLYIWFSLLIKRALFLLVRYPCFNYEQIKSQIENHQD